MVWKSEQIKIKHVHQLQNLYSALTGSELTVCTTFSGNGVCCDKNKQISFKTQKNKNYD